MNESTATYLYCLVAADLPPTLADAPTGLLGTGPLRLLDAGESLWAIVADAPLATYSEEALQRGLEDLDWVGQRALEHENVVEHFIAARALVPMKLFTLFTSDERALADLGPRRDAIDRTLRAVAGRREWGVRVLHDPLRMQQASPPAPGRAPTSGTDFLLRKQAQRDLQRRRSSEEQQRAEALFADLSALADDAQQREPAPGEPRGRLVLDATFLVAESARGAFQAALRHHAEELASAGLEAILSGPWPAYHFIAQAP